MSARAVRRPAPHARRRTVPLVVTAALLGALAALPIAWHGATAAPAGPSSPSAAYLLAAPNLQTAGSPEEEPSGGAVTVIRLGSAARPASAGPAVPARTLGMDGMGESELEIQALTSEPTTIDSEFVSIVTSDVLHSAVLPPRGGRRLALAALPGFEFSNYDSAMTSSRPFGAIVRTTWFGGASASYEAIPPSSDMILPLVARDVYSHSSIIFIQNMTDPSTPNPVTFELFDADGSILESWTVPMPRRESLPDDLYREAKFYEGRLPKNAAGGFLGAFYATSRDPVAVLVMGDEPFGTGAYALTARPRSAANRYQYLPLIRSNLAGDTLVTIANADSRAVDVNLTYRGFRTSPAGAGQTYRQSFRLAGRASANIDLGRGQRGNQPSPAIPRGSEPDRGFLGNLTVSASGPVLAAAWEQQYDGSRVSGAAAYNAFGPADLGRVFVLPHGFGTPDAFATYLVAMNPSDEDAAVTVALLTDDGMRYYNIWTDVPVVGGGGMTLLPVWTREYEHVRVLAESTVPIALIALDGLPVRDRTAHAALKLPDDMIGAFPTPAAPFTPTAGPTNTPTPRISQVPPTPLPTSTGSIQRQFSAWLPALYRKR